MQKNIVLVGLMGAGKSSVARYLSAKLDREVVSTDAFIEEQQKKSIAQIFRDEGEPFFRKREKEAVKEIVKREGIIIDCGGGVVIDPVNIQNLKKNGVIFYISASPGFLYQKIKEKTQRPLMETNDPEARLRQLLAEREVNYRKADHILETTGMTIEQIGGAVIKKLKKE